jgi:lipoprotein-releasing system ATP-binding protein
VTVDAAPGPTLRATGIVKTFRDGELETPVLKGIDFEIQPGEFVALMGPSGSGKSTLLSILGTLLRPTGGEVEIQGVPTSGMDDAELTRYRNRTLGFVFQAHHLMPDFSALENVLFPSYARYGQETPDSLARATSLLERVGLSDRLRYRVTKLSGGQKQRVAAARALMMKPRLVLADEPTGNLDLESSNSLMLLLRELAASEQTAFLISTHDQDIAERCDRIVHIVDGRIAAPAAA